MVEIRKALETDIDILLTFEQGIITAERPFDNTLREGEIHYYDLVEMIQAEWAEVLVAVVENEVVGSGYAKILPAKPYQNHNEYAYLGFMYVKPEFRGQGINQQIIYELMVWSKNKGLKEVRLQVYDENIIAKKAYQKVGFKPNLLEMRLEMEEIEPS
ncbi:MAG: GNAT family N-acetyltransferase [Bacteroidia bacterium]